MALSFFVNSGKIVGRKGFMLLFASLILASVFLFLFFSFTNNGFDDSVSDFRERVFFVSSFVDSLRSDFERAVYIGSFRSLLALEDYVSSRGSFFSNESETESFFRESLVNGTINGSVMDIMNDSSLNSYLLKAGAHASAVGLLVNVSIVNVSLSQDDPWHVKVVVDSNNFVSDLNGLVWWDFNQTVVSVVPVIGLKDPLYSVNTLGLVPNTIRNFSLPSTGFVNESNNDTSVLRQFLEGMYYRASPDAPSLLHRFFNDLSPDVNGIESLVYLPALSDQGLVVFSDRSVVDHIYFSDVFDNSSDRCSIDGMIYSPDWFRIDGDHVDDYELGNLSYVPCS